MIFLKKFCAEKKLGKTFSFPNGQSGAVQGDFLPDGDVNLRKRLLDFFKKILHNGRTRLSEENENEKGR